MKKEKKQIDDRYVKDAFQFMLDFADKRQIDDKTKELVDNLLRCAKEDIAVCHLLYTNKKYSHSIHYLQQSVEKATKAYVLNYGNFSQKEIKEISHNSPDAFVRLFDKMSGYADIISKMYPDIKTDTKDLKCLIKDKNKRLELAKMDYKAFKVIFNMYDSIKDRFKEKMVDIDKLIEGFSLQDLLKESLPGRFDKISECVNGKKNMEIIDQYCNLEGIKKFLSEILDFPMLFTLAGFTFPHFQYTRYPDNEMKPFDYTEDLGIVKATPELITHLERIYNNMRTIIHTQSFTEMTNNNPIKRKGN